jgi:hypothetical protein
VKAWLEDFGRSLPKVKEEILEATSVGVIVRGGPAHTRVPMVSGTMEGL